MTPFFDSAILFTTASCEFAKGVDEFIKADFTREPATPVKLPMVKECKVKLEWLLAEYSFWQSRTPPFVKPNFLYERGSCLMENNVRSEKI
jgi:hypothetical protein